MRLSLGGPACLAEPPLMELGLQSADHRVVPVCIASLHHEGPHLAMLAGVKFGLVARLEWIDAFPDMPSPFDEQETQ